MTYLELCTRMHQYGRIGNGPAGSFPSTLPVVATQGIDWEITQFVKIAWNDIQIMRPQLKCFQQEFTIALTQGAATVTLPSTINDIWPDSELQRGMPNAKLLNSANEYLGAAYWIQPENWFGSRQYISPGAGNPQFFTVRNRTIYLSNAPDVAGLKLVIWGVPVPQQLTVASDNPALYNSQSYLPAEYHDVIVYKALAQYCFTRSDQSPLYAMAEKKFQQIWYQLLARYGPSIQL
jgi:hypothetical protein